MTVTANDRLGHVYIVSRADLKMCYIGQSINDDRKFKHIKPGNYRYDALCADGADPHVDVLETDVPRGDELDQAERDYMRAFEREGWTLVNRLGPDDVWPMVPVEFARKGGKKGGVAGGTHTALRRKADPEFDAYWRRVAASAGMAALRARRAADPEFDARCRAAELEGLARGRSVRMDKLENDPQWRDAHVEQCRKAGQGNKGKIGGNHGTRTMVANDRQCDECGKIANSGNMAKHLRASGHAGYTVISTRPENGVI